MVNCEKVKLIDNFDERNSFSHSPSTKSTPCSISLNKTSTVTNIFHFAVISFCPFEKASLLPLSVIWDHCNGYHQSNSPVMYDIFGSKVWTRSNYTNCTGVYGLHFLNVHLSQVDLVSMVWGDENGGLSNTHKQTPMGWYSIHWFSIGETYLIMGHIPFYSSIETIGMIGTNGITFIPLVKCISLWGQNILVGFSEVEWGYILLVHWLWLVRLVPME